MRQELKNKYYRLIRVTDYDTLQLIDSIFTKMDTIILSERGKDHREEFLDLISVLEFTEEVLYNQMKLDILNGEFV